MRGGRFLFGGGGDLPAEQKLAEADGQCIEQSRDPFEATAWAVELLIEIAAAVDFDLDSVNIAPRRSVPLGDMPARKRLVEAREKSGGTGNSQSLRADPGTCAAPVAVAEHDRRDTRRRRRHRVAIDQQGAAKSFDEGCQLPLDGTMVGPVRLNQPPLQMIGGEGLAPEISVVVGPSWNDPEPAPRASANPPRAGALYDGRIDIVFSPVAVHGGAWRSRDNRRKTTLNRRPNQPVDQGIFEHGERAAPVRRPCNEPARIVAARVRDRQQNRELAARPVDHGLGERRHVRGHRGVSI
jgi:hypothetical protein